MAVWECRMVDTPMTRKAKESHLKSFQKIGFVLGVKLLKNTLIKLNTRRKDYLF